jgi:hypothetical protein
MQLSTSSATEFLLQSRALQNSHPAHFHWTPHHPGGISEIFRHLSFSGHTGKSSRNPSSYFYQIPQTDVDGKTQEFPFGVN